MTLEISKALNTPLSQAVFWSDSNEIQAWSSSKQWKYVPTKENPADLATRGMAASQLANFEIWWQGPKFLREVESKWSENRVHESPTARREIRTRGRLSKAEAQDVQESTLIAVVTEGPLNW